MLAICEAACQPQPITPRVEAPSRARWAAATARGRARAQLAELVGLDHRRERGGAREKRSTTNGVPVAVHAYDLSPA